MFIYFWDRERQSMNGRGSERGRHRIWNRLQALSCQHRARRGSRTHGPRDHDLSRSQTPNRLSHPGAPLFKKLKNIYLFIFERPRQSASGGEAEREGDTESEAGSRLWAVSTEPDAGLELTNCEIVTWAEVWRPTDWATQVPQVTGFKSTL